MSTPFPRRISTTPGQCAAQPEVEGLIGQVILVRPRGSGQQGLTLCGEVEAGAVGE